MKGHIILSAIKCRGARGQAYIVACHARCAGLNRRNINIKAGNNRVINVAESVKACRRRVIVVLRGSYISMAPIRPAENDIKLRAKVR